MVDALQSPESVFETMRGAMTGHPLATCPVVNRFTPGLYIREIHIPAGTVGISMQHRTQHPFVISKGRIEVVSENEGAVTYEAPHCGITQPGTRRLLRALTDTVWTTFHATDETDVIKIGEAILEPEPDPATEMWRLASSPTPALS